MLNTYVGQIDRVRLQVDRYISVGRLGRVYRQGIVVGQGRVDRQGRVYRQGKYIRWGRYRVGQGRYIGLGRQVRVGQIGESRNEFDKESENNSQEYEEDQLNADQNNSENVLSYLDIYITSYMNYEETLH